MKILITFHFILFALFSNTLHAADDVPDSELWKLCGEAPVDSEWILERSDELFEKDSTAIDANQMEVEEGITTLSGSVEIRHNENTIHAQRAIFDDSKTKLDAQGNVKFWTDGIYWHGEEATIDREQNISRFKKGDYRLLEKRGHGKAEKITDRSEQQVTRLENVEYTTCPGGPDDEAPWRLKAKNLKLDHTANTGRALHTILKIKDIPVLYIPYISFALTEERKSGFLPMTIGSTKDSGFDIRTPYYWNIAPDRDATITPRVLGDRGFMLGAQYRYVKTTGQGQFDLEYLPSDNLFQDDDRYLFNTHVEQLFANNRGHLLIDFNQVSDKEYFEDLSTSIDITSQRLLDRRADFRWNGGWWSMLSRVQSYQSVDQSLLSTQQPYDRLPQFQFQTHFPQGNKKLNYQIFGEAVYFDRDDSTTGGRIDFTPEVSYPIRNISSFIVPKLKLRHTQYFLDRNDGISEESPDRTLPILSLDAGLFFEGDLNLGSSQFLHTIEPRIFYLYIPKSGQDDIPIFDTGAYDTSYAQLFREDRFNAADRVGDANQLTLAVTTRLIDKKSGRERMSLSLGQIQYFRDRDVTLPGALVETEDSSDIVAQASLQLTDHWTTRYDLQFDPHNNRTELASLNLRYRPDNNTVYNAAYRMRRDLVDIEQVDFSMRTPINANWSIVGRWNYSLQNNQTIDSLFGVEYNSCCWATRLVGRHYLRNTEGEFDNAIFLQFDMKGLAGFGRNTRDFLQRNIPGYHYEF
ncbi:MAG: LPS-assembly protein LptD [Gammaproteobacteria bacterium]